MNTLEECLKKPYILLTPGPLTTSNEVRMAMLKDWCTWDKDYNDMVQDIRKRLVKLAVNSDNYNRYTSVLMQGSGSFGVEAVLGTVIPKDRGKLFIIANGAYGNRMEEIAKILNINYTIEKLGDKEAVNLSRVREILETDPEITHVSVVHSETTSGMLNPIEKIGELVKEFNKIYIVDAMSSFGGIEIAVDEIGIDFLISSSNKCIQGVPGFSFIICKKESIENCKGQARSLALDMYSQWKVMEEQNGKWRFTSPTHTVRAFYQALLELEKEGGVVEREKRYRANNFTLRDGMKKLGFIPLISDEYQSPIITTFLAPKSERYSFEEFYKNLKKEGFVIYPGKVTDVESFRIGNIGDIYPDDIHDLLKAVEKSMVWR